MRGDSEEIAYLLEQRGEQYALLDLDYLAWADRGGGDRAAEFGLMPQDLAAVAVNYRRAGGAAASHAPGPGASRLRRRCSMIRQRSST
jgi:hypothetical protein